MLDPTSSASATRVTAAGEEPLNGAPQGLRVFGHGVNDRPPLDSVADLLDAGLTESRWAGRLTGPVVKVCTVEAAVLNAFERDVA